METRAHFVIIGLFTILGILGGLGFFIWLASVQIDRNYTQYGVLFANVSGLDQSADVLFNGVSVGRVVGIRIWENDLSKVYVGIEIDANTPIAVDTMAQLDSQGVTGVAYIALSGGAPGAPLLTPQVNGPPIIPSRQSSFQSLVNNAPALLDDVATLIKQLEEVTGSENQQYVRDILQNIDRATGQLDRALADFSQMSETLRTATNQITAFTDGLDVLQSAAQSTLSNADSTLGTITQTFENVDQTVDALQPTVAQANETLAALETLIEGDVAAATNGLRTTLGNADRALLSADEAFARADSIMTTELGPVLSNATQVMTALKADLPAILSDLRAGVAEGRGAISAAAPGIRDFGQLGSEARTLVRRLSELVRDLQQNPTGFLLDNRVPEYRR